MNDAEYEELGRDEDELDLADTDSLPWLESDEGDEDAGGLDTGQILAFLAGLVLLLGGVVGGVWYISNRAAGGEVVADGSVIPAPEGPIKERPANSGGKEFAGTGSVAPLVGEGGSRPAVVAEKPLTPALPAAPDVPGAKPAPTAAAGATAPAPAPTAAPVAAGVGVQLAAYGTRARAEEGWTQISRRTPLLSGVKYRVVEGKVDIGTVYRLQAVAPSRAEAEKLCAGLKAAGVDCQIK
jgi:hypothetical protein